MGFYFPILSWLSFLRIYVVVCLRLKVMACLSFKLDMRLSIDNEFDEIMVSKCDFDKSYFGDVISLNSRFI